MRRVRVIGPDRQPRVGGWRADAAELERSGHPREWEFAWLVPASRYWIRIRRLDR